MSRFLAIVTLLLAAAAVFPQTENRSELTGYLASLEKGGAASIRPLLPQLLTQYDNSPELTYLRARLEPDGLEAVKLYRGILENFPKSDYADDALLHIYQYEYMAGLYQSANADLQRLKTEFPNSPAIAAVNEVVVPNDAATAPVAARVPVKSPPRQEVAAPSAKFSLQVGAFSTSENAGKVKKHYEQLGYPVEVSTKVMERKTLYVVWVGAFASAEQARAESAKLRSREKVAAMVIER